MPFPLDESTFEKRLNNVLAAPERSNCIGTLLFLCGITEKDKYFDPADFNDRLLEWLIFQDIATMAQVAHHPAIKQPGLVIGLGFEEKESRPVVLHVALTHPYQAHTIIHRKGHKMPVERLTPTEFTAIKPQDANVYFYTLR